MSRRSVAIFSLERDLHAHAVAHELSETFEVDCHVVATDRLLDRSGLVWSSEQATAAGRLRSYDGRWFEVEALDAIWWRRVNQPLHEDPRLSDPAIREFVEAEWRAAVYGLARERFRGQWVNHPERDPSAGNKLLQLSVAREVGLRVPHTLVSQDAAEVRDFCRRMGGQVAVKKVHGVAGRPLATVVISSGDLQDDDMIALCPAIYQEVVTGDRHIRANCFGDAVYATLITSPTFDWRRDLSVPFEPYELDRPTRDRLVELLRVLGLRMGVMDLKFTAQGELVWLELNPQGQFLFCQALSGADLIGGFARFLLAEAEKGAGAR